MKTLRNYEKTICGVEYPLFAIIKSQKDRKYYYYISMPWSSNIGDRMIYKSKTKSTLLNKYSLSMLGVLYTALMCIVFYPLLLIAYPLYSYFDGAINFIKNGAWVTNVRFFNWCNIFIMFSLGAWLFFK
jgi:hypothetical protein